MTRARVSRKRKLARIVELARSGLHAHEIAKRFHMTYSSLISFMSYHELNFEKIRHQAVNEDLKRVDNGETNLFRVRAKYGYSPLGFYRYVVASGNKHLFDNERNLQEWDIHDLVDSLEKDGGNYRIDDAIDRGLRLREIAELIGNGHGHSYVDQYIRGTGQYKLWVRRKRDLGMNHVMRKSINGKSRRIKWL